MPGEDDDKPSFLGYIGRLAALYALMVLVLFLMGAALFGLLWLTMKAILP